MIATHEGRENRPGGRWSSPKLLKDLLRLAAIERAIAHVIAGWVPKVPELDDKLAIAAVFEDSIARATALRNRALVLLERDQSGLSVDPSCVQPLLTLDCSPSFEAVVDGLLCEVPYFLLSRYRVLAGQLDSLLDNRLIVMVSAAIDALDSATSPIGTSVSHRTRSGPLSTSLELAWNSDSGRRVPLEQVLWNPLIACRCRLDQREEAARPWGSARISEKAHD